MLSKIDRAKQFLPFDALSGFRQAISKIEEELDDRKELSEDLEKMLDLKIRTLKRGDKIMVTYYEQNKYLEIIDSLIKVDKVLHSIKLKSKTIKLKDVIDVKKW